jgi:hypothetical protein
MDLAPPVAVDLDRAMSDFLDGYLNEFLDEGEKKHPGFERKVREALTRRDLARNGRALCVRCQTEKAYGMDGCPELCPGCISVVVDLQEAAYAEGATCAEAKGPRTDNPYPADGEPDASLKHDHWDAGWTDATPDWDGTP